MDSINCWLRGNQTCSEKHCNDENGCLILYKLDYLYNEAGVDLKLRKKKTLVIDADGTDLNEFTKLKSIEDNIVKFVEEGHQLFLHSSIAGNGKTSWSIRLCQSYFNKIWLKTNLKCRALFINVPSFLIALKANISNPNAYYKHIQENVLDCDLVIWDDIGTKAASSFEHENLLSIIDTRINNGKANIFTSNLSDSEMQDCLGDRLASRICNLDYNIELKGGDKRGL